MNKTEFEILNLLLIKFYGQMSNDPIYTEAVKNNTYETIRQVSMAGGKAPK